MSEEYFEKVLDEISDERIQKAVSYSKKKRIFPFKLAAAVAASLVIVAAGTFAAFLSGLASSYLVMRTVKNKSWIWFAVYLVIPLTISLITM